MDSDRAETIVKQLLSPKYLSSPQEMVFRAAWQGQSYRDLAISAGYEHNYIKGVGAQVWRLLSTATKCRVTKTNFQQVLQSFATSTDLPRSASSSSIKVPASLQLGLNWGEVMDVSAFYGRERECQQLHQWIATDRCRLVAILGMGGMGKTTISIELLRQLQSAIDPHSPADLDQVSDQVPDQFSRIVWRSLLNAPPLKELLPELIRTLVVSVGQPGRPNWSSQRLESPQASRDFQLEGMPKTIGGQIELLLEICQNQRCLIVLDNGESIFQSGAHVGQYRSGYADYGDLFSTLGRMQHQSCLVLTSREKPTEISKLEGVNSKVRTLVLPGLDPTAGQQIFVDRGCLPVPPSEWAEIDRYCGGNPLALQLIAATVQEVADGDITEILPYLAANKLGFVDIHLLLGQQWERLSIDEQQVMYWLAISREPLTIPELEGLLHPAWNHPHHNDQSSIPDQRSSEYPSLQTSGLKTASLLTVLQSLRRRSIIVTGSAQIDGGQRHWALQPMTIEYVTSRFVDQICTEIEQQQPFWLNTHPICQVNTKEYLRQAQLRTIVQPVIDRLRTSVGNLQQIGSQLRLILAQWRIANAHQPGYLAGNLLNFLTYLGLDLTDLDCSELVIQQAYLVETDLPGVNLANAEMVNCAFTQTFSSVLAIAYSPDGQILAASDSSGEIRLWNVRDRQCLLTCSGHTNWVRAIKFSPDGRYLASTSDDRTLKLWDLQEGICLQTIGAGIHSLGFSFSPDGRYIASGSASNTIYYWDLQTGTCVREFVGHQGWSIDVKFHPDGDRLISGGADHTVRIWDISSGECRLMLTGHENWVTTIDCSADGKMILSGSLDQTLRLWDIPALPTTLTESQSCRLVVTGHGDEIWSAAFSPDHQHFASAGVGGLLRVWQTSDGTCCHYLEGHSKRLWSVAFHPDGHYLASGGEDQTIRLWQIDDGKCLQTLNGYTNWFRSIGWSSDGQRLITASRDAQIRVWSINADNSADNHASNYTNNYTNNCLQSLLGHTKSTLTVAIDPQNLTFASGSEDRTIRIWDRHTLACTQILRGHTGGILALVYSPDGKYLVSAGSDLSLRIWDTHRWRCLAIRIGHTDRIGGLAYHPQRDLIASAGEDQTIRIWNLHDPEPVQILAQQTNRAIAVAFAPSGQILASGGMDSQITLWDIETGSLCQTLAGHTGWILSLAYSLDGQWLFSGASDDTIKVWSIATGVCINTLVGHQSWVWSIAVSPCGGFLASASEDETIKVWDLTNGSVVSTRRAGRPYEGMNISGITGLTKAQVDGLRVLGAMG